MMKKALMVLGLAVCTSFAFAQTNNVSISKSKHDATVAPKAPNAALVDYKASIFTKNGDTLVTWEFDQSMASSVTSGTIGANDMIADTIAGNASHQQSSAAALWARIPDSAYTHGTAFESTYPDLAASSLMNGIRLRMGAYNMGNDNGFMFVDLYEAPRNSGNFNTYMVLPVLQTPANTGVIDIAFRQAAAKYYEQYFIDYKVGNNWRTREVNVEGIDCDVNSWIAYRATYVMPLELAQQPTIELRFRVYSYGRGAIYGRFWAVDNVSVIAYPNPTERWQNYGEKYIDGAYGTLPEGMTIPLTWASTIYNTGTNALNNVNMQMSHLYFDNEELQTNVFLTVPQSPIAVGATKVVKIDERGFYNEDEAIDYQGWLGYSENYAVEHIGSPWTLRGIPSSHPGFNYVTATAVNGDLNAEWDTILYRVSEMEEVEPGMIEGYRWAHDNGLIPSGAVYCAQFDDEGYITDDPESSDHYTRSGYSMSVRYTTGNDIPEGWVIRGLEYVVATTADIMDNAAGAQFVPLAYTEEYSEDGQSVGWNVVPTGVSSAIVEVSENDLNTLETGYILPGQSYRAINVLFPEQPALEPNTAYRFGYRLNRDGFFAPASIAWSYMNEQGSRTAYYDDANVAPFYNQFLHGTYYDVYINDPAQPDPNRNNYLWASGYFEGTPMIRPIVGPAMEIPRTTVYPQCEGDTNYYIEYEDEDVCGADISVAEGSSPVFYVVPLGDNMVIDQVFVDGVAVEPWNEEEGTGDENCWTGEYNVTDENDQVVLRRNWIAYQYPNITAPAAGQAHTIRATCHWEPWHIGIDPVAANVSLGLSPNPATSQVSMNIKGVTGMVNCNIIDMSGRVVYNANINAEQAHTINLSNIPAGAYFVRVTNNDFSKVEKLIVR